jgi:hypothetical protein
MLSRPQVEIVRYRQMATRQDCDNEFDNIAAVYAWFRDLTLSPTVLGSEESFVDTILQLLDNPLSEKRESHISPFYEVGLTIKAKELSSSKTEALRQYARDENIRQEIGSALEAMTFWQVPLYIGKTHRLADRVWEHVNRDTDLANRLEKAGLDIQRCLLAYVPILYLDDEYADLMPLEQLLEDIITRLSAPGFVRRIG